MSMCNSFLRFMRTAGMLVSMLVLGTLATIVHIVTLPVTMFVDPFCNFNQYINVLITKMATAPFVDVKMKGLEKIVPGQTYCIAANHTSALDAFVMALLGDKSNFRSIIKHTLKYYPVFGALFYFGGFVFVNRKQPESRSAARARTRELLNNGVSVLYFPEGTRSAGPMLPFSPGAFKTAVEARVPILPITMSGVRVALPLKGWPLLGWFGIEVTVHDPIPTDTLSLDIPEDGSPSDVMALAEKTRAVIGSALRPVDFYAGYRWEEDQETFMAAWKGPESFEAANEAVGADWKTEQAKALRRATGRPTAAPAADGKAKTD